MRLIVQYERGNASLGRITQSILFPEDVTETQQIISQLAKKFKVLPERMIIRFKRDSIWLRVVQGWPLQFYQLESGCILQAEFLQQLQEQDKSQLATKQRFKLLNHLSQGHKFTQLEQVPEEDELMINKNLNLDKILQEALRFARQGDIKALKESLEEDIHEGISLQQTATLRNHKEAAILNHLSCSSGWGIIHQATFGNKDEIIFFLISKGCNTNRPTSDGWTPLQIAVKHQCRKALMALLTDTSLNLNQNTSKETALHVAARMGRVDEIKILLTLGAEKVLKNQQGKTAHEVALNSACGEFLKNFTDQPRRMSENKGPRLIKGTILKLVTLTQRLKERYLVIEPLQGNLLRYENEKDFPANLKEVISLNSISEVRMVQTVPWYLKKSLSYFQLIGNKELIFACKDKHIAQLWVQSILSAKEYAMKAQSYQYTKRDVILITQKSGTFKVVQQRIKSNVKSFKEQLLEEINFLRRKFKLKKKYRRTRPKKEGESSEKTNTITDMSFCSKQRDPSLEVEQDQKKEQDQMLRYEEQTDAALDERESIKSSSISDFSEQEAEKRIDQLNSQKIQFSSFELLKTIGNGAFGKVFLAKLKTTGKLYALKALKKKTLIIKRQLNYAITQCTVMKMIKSSFIVQMHYAFQTAAYLYIAMDYCSKGDFSYHITQRQHLTEKEAQFYIAELLLAINALHQQNIIYRDLKPQNLLINQNGHLKLTDFGLAKCGIQRDMKTKTFCGTPAYISPDMLSMRGAGKQIDLYGLGTMLYYMLQGHPPFQASDIPTLYRSIKSGKLMFHKASSTAQSLIRSLMDKNPKKRIGSAKRDEIKEHVFFEGLDWKGLEEGKLDAPLRGVSYADDWECSKVQFTDFDYEAQKQKANRVIGYSFAR